MHDSLYHRWVQKWEIHFRFAMCAEPVRKTPALLCSNHGAPCDCDELERIRIHRAARAGKGFVTLEQGRNLPVCLEQADHSGVFLLDSVTALLANEMFPTNAQPDETATERIAADLGTFLGAVEHAVVVSDYLYGDGIAYDPVTERYRRGLAYLDRFLAERCDCVVEICLGRPVAHKGRLPALEGKT